MPECIYNFLNRCLTILIIYIYISRHLLKNVVSIPLQKCIIHIVVYIDTCTYEHVCIGTKA